MAARLPDIKAELHMVPTARKQLEEFYQVATSPTQLAEAFSLSRNPAVLRWNRRGVSSIDKLNDEALLIYRIDLATMFGDLSSSKKVHFAAAK